MIHSAPEVVELLCLLCHAVTHNRTKGKCGSCFAEGRGSPAGHAVCQPFQSINRTVEKITLDSETVIPRTEQKQDPAT